MCLHFKTETTRCRLLIDVPNVSLFNQANLFRTCNELSSRCAVPFVCLLNNCADRNKQKNKEEKKKQERKKGWSSQAITCRMTTVSVMSTTTSFDFFLLRSLFSLVSQLKMSNK